MNLQTEKTEEYKAPSVETAWSRVKKALGPIAVVGVVIANFSFAKNFAITTLTTAIVVVIAKFFAKLKFVLLLVFNLMGRFLTCCGSMVLMTAVSLD